MRTLYYLIITALFALAITLAWAISTTGGARWLVGLASDPLPAFSARVEAGSLVDGLELAAVRWDGPAGRYTAESVAIDWRPACLQRWTVCIQRLVVEDLTLRPGPGPGPGPDPATGRAVSPARPAAMTLPTLSLPLALELEQARIQRLALVAGQRRWALDQLVVAGAWKGTEVTLRRLAMRAAAGRLRGEGRVVLRDHWPLALDLQLTPDPALSGGMALQSTLALRGDLADLALTGRLSGLETGPVALDLSLGILEQPLRVAGDLRASGGSVGFEARVGAELAITGEANVEDFSAFWPGLAGSLAGTFDISGTPASPAVTVDVAARGLGYRQFTLATASLEGAWTAVTGGRIRLAANGLRQGDRQLGDLTARLEGAPADHTLALGFERGPTRAQLTLAGGLTDALTGADAVWAGTVTGGVVNAPTGDWQLVGRPDLTIDPAARALTLAGHCWVRDGVRICTEPLVATPERAALRLSLGTLELALLKPWLPPAISLPGNLSGTASLVWQAGTAPKARLTLVSRDGRIEIATGEGQGQGQDEMPFSLPYDRVVVDADLQPDRVDLRLGVAAPDLGTGGLVIGFDPGSLARDADQTALTGEIWLDGVPLAPLAGALGPLRAVSGRLGVRGALGGTVAMPRFNGEVAVRDATVQPAGITSAFKAVELLAQVTGRRARIEGGFRAGAGRAELGGRLDWEQGPLTGELMLKGEGLEIDQGTLAGLRISPDLQLAIEADALRLGGYLDIPWARIQLVSLPAGATRVSADAVRVDRPAAPADAPGAAPARRFTSDLRLRLGEDVRFEGFGANGRLTGSLRLQQANAEPVLGEGVLELVGARYRAYGQDLGVRRGRLIFAGPLDDPRLDVEAVREVGDVLAGIRLDGSVRSPGVTLFSRPAMEQATILAYLLTGRPPGQGTPGEEALLGQAALSLGVFGGGELGEALAAELGIEDFQLEASGQGEEAQVAVSGYLAPNLLLRYGVGVFEPVNTLSLRYYFTRQLYLEAVSGTENAVDIFYSFDYD